MNRYFLSFIITLFIYSIFIIGFLSYNNTPKPLKIKTKKSIESVKFTVIKQVKIEPKPIIKPDIIIPPIPITPPKPKLTKPIKPIIKKDENLTIKRPKPIIKPKIVKKIKPKKRRKVTKKVVKKSNKNIRRTLIKKSKSLSKKGVIGSKSNQKKEARQKEYYSKISKAINRNKSYPSKAKRRNIEGKVKVRVTLSKDGKLILYKILTGNRVFKKSIKNAIKKSFPIKPPKGMFNSNIDFSFTISYKLY